MEAQKMQDEIYWRGGGEGRYLVVFFLKATNQAI